MFVALATSQAGALTSAPSFSGGALAVVESAPVRSLIATTVAGRVAAQTGASAAALEPIVDAAVGRALENQAVRGEIQAAAGSLESELLAGRATRLTLALPRIGPALSRAVLTRDPRLAYVLDRLGTVTVVDVPIAPGVAADLHALARASQDAALLGVLAAALAALALILSQERRRTLRWLGLGALVSGLAAVGAYLLGRQLVTGAFSAPAAAAAAGSAWHAALGGLEGSGLLLALAGAGVAALGTLAGALRPRG